MNHSRLTLLRQWPARRAIVDPNAIELDACLPPSTAAILSHHEPVYQAPKPTRRRVLTAAIAAVARRAQDALSAGAAIHGAALLAGGAGIAGALYIVVSAAGVI